MTVCFHLKDKPVNAGKKLMQKTMRIMNRTGNVRKTLTLRRVGTTTAAEEN